MRPIKYRAWDAEAQEMVAWEIIILDGFHKYLEGPLMQYIGINDSTGKEVYEGDIITFDDTDIGGERLERCEVLWATDFTLVPSPCFALWVHRRVGGGFTNNMFGEIEVIGNIHENPELLRVYS